MFDLSFAEILLVVVIAVFCIGPKELPGLLRMVGKMVGQVRRITQGFWRELQLDDDGQVPHGQAHVKTRKIIGDDGQEYEAYDVPATSEEEAAPPPMLEGKKKSIDSAK